MLIAEAAGCKARHSGAAGFQFLARSEVVALKHVLNPAVEPLDHAIGLR